jgi:hypothetical protein
MPGVDGNLVGICAMNQTDSPKYFSITSNGLDKAYSFVTLNEPAVSVEECDNPVAKIVGFELLKFKSSGCEVERDVEGIFPEIE